MIDLERLMEKDKEVSDAVDILLGSRIELDYENYVTMIEQEDEDLLAIVNPFFKKAIDEVARKESKKAKNKGRKNFEIRAEDLLEQVLPLAVDAFNDDAWAVASFWTVWLLRIKENSQTEKELREKILRMAEGAVEK